MTNMLVQLSKTSTVLAERTQIYETTYIDIIEDLIEWGIHDRETLLEMPENEVIELFMKEIEEDFSEMAGEPLLDIDQVYHEEPIEYKLFKESTP